MQDGALDSCRCIRHNISGGSESVGQLCAFSTARSVPAEKNGWPLMREIVRNVDLWSKYLVNACFSLSRYIIAKPWTD